MFYFPGQPPDLHLAGTSGRPLESSFSKSKRWEALWLWRLFCRMRRLVWEKKVSPNVIYSMQGLQSDTSTLVVGGIDGILRVLDQTSGEILSSCSMDQSNGVGTRNKSMYGEVERRKVKRLPEDDDLDSIVRTARPPIRCLAVGMKKVVTTHNDKHIRVWRFG